MTFIEPSLQKIYDTLVNNNDLINLLKEKGYLVTKKALYENYTQEQVAEMEVTIFANNSNTMYEVAQVLLNYSNTIKENQIWYLISHKIGWAELSAALGTRVDLLDVDAYKQIMFTYKYCVVSSFFQNNQDKFIPEADFYEMENNPAAKAFYDAMMKEFDKLEVTIEKCLEYTSYDDIPYDLINYLTQLLGWEKSDINADESTEMRFRELAKNILDIYRIKGTNYSFELFFNFLGFNIEISEYYFDRRLYYTTNSGNEETENSNNGEYEYYLTVNNPADNKLPNIGIGEVVEPGDFSSQYSLHEFNQLCKQYGPAAVLGYSPIYPVYTSNGDLIEYRKYEGKVYKYFKTNVIYYTLNVKNTNPTEKQLTAVTKYLDFLTPSYVMRKIRVKTYMEKTEEPIGFDGDGTEEADAYGNFNSFQMLDSEDWPQHFKDAYTSGSKEGLLQYVDENNYEGKEETFKTYVNSVGTNKFRMPLGKKTIAKSVNKFLNGGTGTNYPGARRLKYYILHLLDGKETDNWTAQNIVIAPYYTIPPFIGTANYLTIKNEWDKKTKLVNLTGGDGEGGEECVKTQVRDADIRTPIDFVTDKSIGEFIQEESFNELLVSETFAKKLTKVASYDFGNDKYNSAYEAYLWEINQRKLHICNLSVDSDAFEKEVIWKNDVYKETKDNKAAFNSEIYTEAQITDYYKNDILKNLNFGDYIVSYSGTLTKGKLNLYRFGYTPYPIAGDSAQYQSTYSNYINSFDYKIKRDYNGVLSKFESVNLQASYITKQTIADVENYVKGLRDDQIKVIEKKGYAEWPEINFITDKLFYVASDGEYYRAVKIPAFFGNSANIYPSGKNHKFASMDEALAYFEVNPSEKVNNAEFYIENGNDKGLYCFEYKNRIKGKLIYSLKDEKLYRVYGSSLQDIKEVENWYGNLEIKFYTEDPDGEFYQDTEGLVQPYSKGISGFRRLTADEKGNIKIGEINKYDQYWKGYYEEADEEDFIFYNAKHKISWSGLNIYNEFINRPIKQETDKDFDEDEAKLYDSYTEDAKDKFFFISGKPYYYNTFGQRIINEISEKTIDLFTSEEQLDWYIEDGAKHVRGILSIIENNMKDLCGYPRTREIVFYSKASDFFQDYYRMIMLGNMTKLSIPKKIIEAKTGKEIDDIDEEDIDKIKEEIIKAYNLSINQIADKLDTITKSRVYYSYIGNWKSIIGDKVINWEGALRENGKIDAEAMFKDPLSLNKDYGPSNQKKIGNKYYFDERTNFVSNIISLAKDLRRKYNLNLNFNFSTKERKKLFGKDTYSLASRNGDSRYFEIPENFKYEYKSFNAIKTLQLNEHICLSYDSIYNFFIPYTLNYGLRNYSLDFYGEQRDPYSEFTELFDFFHTFAEGKINTAKDIDSFLKKYYYKKLSELYREEFIGDKEPLNIETYGKKPQKAYPKLPELLDGKAGTFAQPSTLLSTFTNNGKTFGNTKLKFFKVKVSLAKDYQSTKFTFYIYKKDFIDCFGYDLNKYYLTLDLQGITDPTAYANIYNTIIETYKKQFACVRPHFFAKEKIYDITHLTNWQKARPKFEVDFAEADFENIDKDGYPVTNSSGYVIGKNGLRTNTAAETKKRLAEGNIIALTIEDKTITPLLKLNAQKAFFKDIVADEEGNIEGYLTVKKLEQKLSDNYISKPYSLPWVEKDSEKEPIEYTSFGDDRSVDITINNHLITEDNFVDYLEQLRKNKRKDDTHNEEVASFDQYGRVLVKGNSYVQFDKKKTFADQGLKVIFKKVASKVRKFGSNERFKKQLIEFEKNGIKQYIDGTKISVYYNAEGELCLEVPNTKLTTSNFEKVSLMFLAKYLNIKVRSILIINKFLKSKFFIIISLGAMFFKQSYTIFALSTHSSVISRGEKITSRYNLLHKKIVSGVNFREKIASRYNLLHKKIVSGVNFREKIASRYNLLYKLFTVVNFRSLLSFTAKSSKGRIILAPPAIKTKATSSLFSIKKKTFFPAIHISNNIFNPSLLVKIKKFIFFERLSANKIFVMNNIFYGRCERIIDGKKYYYVSRDRTQSRYPNLMFFNRLRGFFDSEYNISPFSSSYSPRIFLKNFIKNEFETKLNGSYSPRIFLKNFMKNEFEAKTSGSYSPRIFLKNFMNNKFETKTSGSYSPNCHSKEKINSDILIEAKSNGSYSPRIFLKNFMNNKFEAKSNGSYSPNCHSKEKINSDILIETKNIEIKEH